MRYTPLAHSDRILFQAMLVVLTMLPERYTFDALQEAVRDPTRFKLELIRLALTVNRSFYERFGRHDGVDVFAEEWDNLVILDGCRYDLFERRASLPGILERRYSSGSDSWAFMDANFAGRRLHDTVYVTANPHVGMLPDGTFHDVVNLLDDHWDEEYRTVPPTAVAEATLRTYERYPDKRVISHFMQPHFPFIGETGRSLRHMGLEMHLDEDEKELAGNPWFDLVYDDVPVETIVTAYRENLDVALPAVEELLAELPGTSVVTADHGNLLGERTWPIPIRTFGHPRGLKTDDLLEVPWLVADGDRREHVAEPPVERSKLDDDVVEERLADLGYA